MPSAISLEARKCNAPAADGVRWQSTAAPHASRSCRHCATSPLWWVSRVLLPFHDATPLRWELRHTGARVACPSWRGRSEFARQRRLRCAVGLPFRAETKASCVSVWSRTRSLHTLRYVSPPYLTPSLTRCGAIAAQVGRLSIPTPELPMSASGIGMGRLTCYAWLLAIRHSMPPLHEGDTYRTLKTSPPL